MTVTTENSIRALLSSSEEAILSELSLIKHTLERLFASDEAQIPKEESSKDLLKIGEVSERIREAKSPRQKLEIYSSEYIPLSKEIKAKYSDFLVSETFKEIEAHEKYMDGLGESMANLEEGIDRARQYTKLYMGMVRLSELIEEYFFYFPQDLIEHVKNIALAFLNDSSLKPDKTHQSDSVFSYSVALKNTARAVLWQIEENRTKNEKFRPIGSPSDTIFTREMQIQKNQRAIDWAKSRLEQIESIREAKGWKL